jgi:hypothetical protein
MLAASMVCAVLAPCALKVLLAEPASHWQYKLTVGV